MELDLKEEDLATRIEAQRRKRRMKPTTAETTEPPDPVQAVVSRLRKKIRAGAEAKSACDELKKDFPEYSYEIERELRKLLGTMREEL